MNGCTGLRTVASIRSSGKRPRSVHVTLRPHLDREDADYPLLDGRVSVQVSEAAELKAIDWRPLVGLDVFVWCFGVDENRLRKVARAISAVHPRTMRVMVPDGDDVTMQRYEGGKWLPGVRL